MKTADRFTWLLVGAAIADIGCSVWVLIQSRRRAKAWDTAIADDIETAKATDASETH